MALFAQFAMAATHEALDDAAWRPTSPEQRAETVCLYANPYKIYKSMLTLQGVCLGSGIGNFEEIYNTVVSYEQSVSCNLGCENVSTNASQGYKKISPLFVPKLLINLGAGHISMKFGFTVRCSSSFLPVKTN